MKIIFCCIISYVLFFSTQSLAERPRPIIEKIQNKLPKNNASNKVEYLMITDPDLDSLEACEDSLSINSSMPRCDEPLIGLIDKTTSFLSAAIYDIDHPKIIEALCRASSRGVYVEMIMDEENAPAFIEECPCVEKLNLIPYHGTGGSREMHHKFAIFDKSIVWMGSYNWTCKATYANLNTCFTIRDEHVTDEYMNRFDELYICASEGCSRGDYSSTPDGNLIESYFIPGDSFSQNLCYEFEKADTAIDVAIFYFTEDIVGDCLSAAAHIVPVRVVIDSVAVNNSGSEASKLCDALCHVRSFPRNDKGGFLHYKQACIDGEVILSGSPNYSANAEDSNFEDYIKIDERSSRKKQIAEACHEAFEKIWAQSNPVCN